MIKIGNYADYIQQDWLDFIKSNQGIAKPNEQKTVESQEEQGQFDKLIKAGYDPTAIYHYVFHEGNFTLNIPQPPWDTTSNYKWWFTKMLPGNFMPMHLDAHVLHLPNSKRYWVALQDWEPGHIFMYEDIVITDYKMGDVYVYDDQAALHGAANIGYNPRYILQISTYD